MTIEKLAAGFVSLVHSLWL